MDLRSPSSSEHLEALADIFGMTFTTYWARRAYVTDGYIAESAYDWDASRIGVVDGEIATHFGVWDLTMRVGVSRLRVAGIGAVATLEHHRGKGLMSQTASECVAGMSDAGYDVSLLFGITNFYHRFGYEVCFSDRSFRLTTRDVKASEQPVQTEIFIGDVTDLAEMYNRDNETVTGTYVRPTYRLNRKPKDHAVRRFAGGYIITTRQGNLLQVVDCAGDPATILEAVRVRAVEELCPEIQFSLLPPRSAMGEYLQTLSYQVELYRQETGGPMLLITNLTSTFEKLCDELSRRLARSAVSGYTGVIEVVYGEESIALSITDGRVTVGEPVDTPSGRIVARDGLPRLIIGDGDPERVARQSGVELTGDARYLLPILFPDQEPSTIMWDRF